MVKSARYLIVLVCLGALVSMAGCGISGGMFGKSPGDAVKAVYMAANEGQYSEAEEHMSTELLAAMQSGVGALLTGGVKGSLDDATRDGTIDRIEILSEEIRGEGAIVSFRVYYDDGETKDDEESLIKEDGDWKIALD